MARKTQTEIILDDRDFNIVRVYDNIDPNQDIYDFIKKNGWITYHYVEKMRGIKSSSSSSGILNGLVKRGKLVRVDGFADVRDKLGNIRRTRVIFFKLPPKPIKNK